MRHYIDTTYEQIGDNDAVIASVELRIWYTFRAPQPAYIPRGEYQPIDSGCDAEIELDHVEVEDWDGRKSVWRADTAGEWTEWAESWLEKNSDMAVNEAAADLADLADMAAEQRAEMRRERIEL